MPVRLFSLVSQNQNPPSVSNAVVAMVHNLMHQRSNELQTLDAIRKKTVLPNRTVFSPCFPPCIFTANYRRIPPPPPLFSPTPPEQVLLNIFMSDKSALPSALGGGMGNRILYATLQASFRSEEPRYCLRFEAQLSRDVLPEGPVSLSHAPASGYLSVTARDLA
jgi:hypothetical protein